MILDFISNKLYLVIFIKVCNTNKKRGQFTSSTFLRYRQTPNVLKLVNAHAMRRELSTLVLVHFLEFLAIFRNKKQKWTFSIMSLYYYLSP